VRRDGAWEDGTESVRLWPARLRWRFRGALLWPAFAVLTIADGVLLADLPPYAGAPDGVLPAVLLAGFVNLFILAGVAPLAGRLLRRRRRDLPRSVAADYAGSAIIVALFVLVLAGGLAHRPAVAAHERSIASAYAAVHDYVTASAPEYRSGLGAVDALELSDHAYRACVPGHETGRWLCLYVDTDQTPAGIRRDPSTESNASLRYAGGFR
jgi:hypothetical protein